MSRNRAHLFTWNNYPSTYSTILDGLPARYIVAGEERAPGTGTPHLQGYVVWTQGRTESAVRRMLPGCHITVARGDHSQNDRYCRKTREIDGTPNESVYSRGDLPASATERGAVEKARWESAWNSAKLGDLEAIPADIRVRQYNVIRRIERDFMPAVERLAGPCGIWIHGAAGSGKSKSVFDQIPNVFSKPRNKWWDGYQREEFVVVDDVDRFDVRLGGMLKHWADAYPFIGESKGGSVKIRPKKILVTSQYTIEEIWQDSQSREALLRRFVVIEKLLGQNIIIQLYLRPVGLIYCLS